MTLDQLIAEMAAQPSQVRAFQVMIDCLKIEMTDAAAGNSPPPSLQAKYDEIFGTAFNKANEFLHAIEDGKPGLDPLPAKVEAASDPMGPKSETVQPAVFKEKPVVLDEPAPSPFSEAHEPVEDQYTPIVPNPNAPKPVAPVEETK
jgi:hypothetical protein